MTDDASEESYHLEGVAFGLADGLIMCLGLIIGVAEVTADTRFVVIAGVIGGFANAFGNSIGFFMSQSAERALQIHETTDHGKITRIHSRKEVLTNSIISFISTVAAVGILLAPFALLQMNEATILTFIVGSMMAFLLGSYTGRLCHENAFREGLKYAALAILGAVISHFIADLIQILV
ncbi:MAG: VIT1/CCC1 transporter family protein [Candidatus Bathyarchaeota archaeon]|nr:MAG: VIT1/CCC1 transporter family protein [Candidatus Bathyarchaeota archaeon]